MTAQTKKPVLEREYVIPLRRAWLKTSRYERTAKAVKTIKKFIAKHMKVEDRDLKKVKLDVHLNNELWFRGRKNPPAKVKVKAVREDDIVRVDFVEMPEYVKFKKQKLEKRHKPGEKKPEKPEEQKPQEEKSEEKKTEEKEKEQAVAEQHVKEAEMQAKAQKHLTKVKEPTFHRMALKK